MGKTYGKSIFIFHRSLRLNDNIGLIKALQDSVHVIPIFIFTPEQITNNKFKSNNAIQFMIDSLKDLDVCLNVYKSRMYFFYGKVDDILNKILNKDDDIEAIFVNKDYTKYAINRENIINKICDEHNIDFHTYEDYLLHPMNFVKNSSDSFYQKFTPFYNNCINNNFIVNNPIKNNYKNYIGSKYNIKGELSNIDIILKDRNQNMIFVGSREEGLNKIKNIKNQKLYPKTRNLLNLKTTLLSPYIKFGLVSIREVYHRIKKEFGIKHDLIKQLYWREFYYNLSFNRLDVFDGMPVKENYTKIKWDSNEKLLKKWENGKTGYPIVDAGMRELNTTGYMHNRARLITSNFLVKLGLIDWRLGEKYFAKQLVDYDPSVNNGNWQWTAGSGADSQEYFRIFNPWTQSLKFDKNCEYIKKWIPELKNVENKDIHNWNNEFKKYPDIKYPKPIIDYAKSKKRVLSAYKKIF